jgi:hypothetical protein
MSIAHFENELKLLIAHAAEFEHDDFVLGVTIGSKNNEGEVRYIFGLAHETHKLADTATNAAALNEIAVFMQNFHELPTTVIICHVQNIPRDVVVTYLSEQVLIAASLPVPIDVGDVELLTIPYWTRS